MNTSVNPTMAISSLQLFNLPFPIVELHFYKFVNYKPFDFGAK